MFIYTYLYMYYKHLYILHNCNCIIVGLNCKPIYRKRMTSDHIPSYSVSYRTDYGGIHSTTAEAASRFQRFFPNLYLAL